MKSFHEMMADKMSGGDDAPDSSADLGDAPDDGAGLKAAAQSLIDAVHSKDPDAVADALKSAFALCGDDDGAGDDGADDKAGGHSALLLIPHGGKGGH